MPAAKKNAAPAPVAAEEAQAVRDGEANPKSLNDRSAPRPGSTAPTVAASEETRVAPADPALAKVVPLFAPTRSKGARGAVSVSQPPKGYREVEVIAERAGYYDNARKRRGDVFSIGVVGNGALPSWVRLANAEDAEPEVARSRGIPQSSTEEERRADIEADAGTVQPMALGGTGRQPDAMRS
jgi:hypothetical protein